MGLSIIVLAAGQGTRMRSDRPKVLHSVAGKPLLWHVLTTVTQLKPDAIYIVHGYGGEQLQAAFTDFPFKSLHWVHQAVQQGTGDAVKHVLPLLKLKPQHDVLILLGDMPLISVASLQALRAALTSPTTIGLLTAQVADPAGLGRIVRDEQAHYIKAVVEDKDLSDTAIALQLKYSESELRAISEINMGVFALSVDTLTRYLPALTKDNAQQEYYLTQLIELAYRDQCMIKPVQCQYAREALGVNTRAQLAQVERSYQAALADQLTADGVQLADPKRIDIRGSLTVGKDVFIDVNAVFEGNVVLGDRCHIEPNVIIRDSELANDVHIRSHTVIDGARIAAQTHIGPFARIRPGTVLSEEVYVGSFVELKQTTLGQQTKVGHLTYLGNATVGKFTNIGAGTITCNYNGADKYETHIGDDVFIGSSTLLRAPVNIGDHATTGAGAVIRHDVPDNQLSITWQEQRLQSNWCRPIRQKTKTEN